MNARVQGWVVVVGLLVAGLAYWPVWFSLHRRWQQWSEFYSHGYPLLAISVYCLIASRAQLVTRAARCPLPWFIVALALVLQLLWFTVWLAQIEIAQQLLLPLLLFVCALLMLGWRASLLLSLPLALLVLAIPVWDYAIPLLQRMAVFATSLVLKAVHIPSHIEGNFIHVPGGVVEIAGGCSGLSFLLVSLALGLLYCRQNRLGLSGAIVVMTVAAVSGLSANWLRVSSLAIIGNYTSMRHRLMTEHFYYGWFIFFCCFMAMLALLKKLPLPVTQAHNEPIAIPLRWQRIIAIVALMMLAPAAVVINTLYAAAKIQPSETILSERLAARHWHAVAEAPTWRHGFSGFDNDLRLRSGEWPGIHFEIVRYAEQSAGKKLISSNNNILGAERWTIAAQSSQDADRSAEMILRNREQQRMLVWYWYEVGDQQAWQSLTAKRAQIMASLHGRRDAAWLALSLPCDTDCARERVLLRDARAVAGDLYRQLFQQD